MKFIDPHVFFTSLRKHKEGPLGKFIQFSDLGDSRTLRADFVFGINGCDRTFGKRCKIILVQLEYYYAQMRLVS